MSTLYVVLAYCIVACILAVIALLLVGHRPRRDKPCGYVPVEPSETPLFDQVAAELHVFPDRWKSAGDEQDVTQALRVVEEPTAPGLRSVK